MMALLVLAGCAPTDKYVRIEFLQTRPAEAILAEQGKEAEGQGVVADFAKVIEAAAPFAGIAGGWGVAGLAVTTVGGITTGGIEKFGETATVALRVYVPGENYGGLEATADAQGRWNKVIVKGCEKHGEETQEAEKAKETKEVEEAGETPVPVE